VDVEDMPMEQLFPFVFDSGRRMNLDAMNVYSNLGQEISDTFEEWAMADDIGEEFWTQLANIVRDGMIPPPDTPGKNLFSQ
jgi:hypothetical protein